MKNFALLLSLSVLLILPSFSYAVDCANYSTMLGSCIPFTCIYTHPMTGEPMEKKIIGEKEGKCLTSEQMPGSGRLECAYTAELRRAVAQELLTIYSSKVGDAIVSSTLLMDDKSKAKLIYTINGKQVSSPSQEAVDSGQCKVLGYKSTQDSQDDPVQTVTVTSNGATITTTLKVSAGNYSSLIHLDSALLAQMQLVNTGKAPVTSGSKAIGVNAMIFNGDAAISLDYGTIKPEEDDVLFDGKSLHIHYQ